MNLDRSVAGGLVLASLLLVACGDDTSQGAGGAGGGSTSVTGHGGSGGSGGGGGGRPDDPCHDADPPGLNLGNDDACEDWQTGVLCPWAYVDTGTNQSGVLECVGGEWTQVACPLLDTSFTCPDEGDELDACDDAWSGLFCPWATADAGFSCEGRAQCQDGRWVSLGIDSYEEYGEGGAGGGT